MLNLILKFVSISRAAGLRVATSEVLDCLHQLELVDMLDETQFAAVLRANFAKSRREQLNFARRPTLHTPIRWKTGFKLPFRPYQRNRMGTMRSRPHSIF